MERESGGSNAKRKVKESLPLERASASEMSSKLDATQVMLGPILHILCMLYEDCGLYEKSRYISPHMRPLV